VNLLVERLRLITEDLARARSRRAFVSALDYFQRMLVVAQDSPAGFLTEADSHTIAALADSVATEIEERLERHADRAGVQRRLAAAIYEISRGVEAIHTVVRPNAGLTAQNTPAAPAASTHR